MSNKFVLLCSFYEKSYIIEALAPSISIWEKKNYKVSINSLFRDRSLMLQRINVWKLMSQQINKKLDEKTNKGLRGNKSTQNLAIQSDDAISFKVLMSRSNYKKARGGSNKHYHVRVQLIIILINEQHIIISFKYMRWAVQNLHSIMHNPLEHSGYTDSKIVGNLNSFSLSLNILLPNALIN